MELKMSGKMRAIYEDLRANYFPEPGEYLFFDLSVENYKPQKFSDAELVDDLVGDALANDRPNALICYYPAFDFPILSFNADTFQMIEDLATNTVIKYHEYQPIDLKQIALELQQLEDLLNSKTC